MDREFIGVILFFVAVIVALLGVAIWTDSIACHSKWERTGFHVDFGPIQGCMIKTPRGWIPAENYRSLD